jgi:Fe2+ or Zn2+ uptake regulation protein
VATGGRRTAARQAIIDVLLDGNEHLTAEEIGARVQQHLPAVTMSTVYRTLSALEQVGVLDHTHLGHGRAVYHLADSGHQHLFCERCGRVIELPPRKLDAFARMLKRDFDFELDRRHFAIGGLCAECG